jgi:hypothetical protein
VGSVGMLQASALNAESNECSERIFHYRKISLHPGSEQQDLRDHHTLQDILGGAGIFHDDAKRRLVESTAPISLVYNPQIV